MLLSLAPAVLADGVVRLVYYDSPIDDSRQAYGVYIPESPPPPDGYPVVLHAHGYGWSVSTGFSQWQKDWADAHRWLIVNLNARGPNFYWGIGDVATREVIDDLELNLNIDHRRVYITGGSMGGTGAFRQGVVHPDYIAAAVGVDGWTDFREWHYHWYARKDQNDDIEEFRRPLLEVGSPIYVAERARWGDVYVIADGQDTVVLPWQEIDFAALMGELALKEPGTYDSGLTLHYDKGHGGGYDVPWIYNYFLGKSVMPHSSNVVISTTWLDHGEMYWGRMERQHFQGQKSLLDCSSSVQPFSEVKPAIWDSAKEKVALAASAPEAELIAATLADTDEVGVLDIVTTNLDAFTLQMPTSPVADLETVLVFADGVPAYLGPPEELTFEALRDESDALAGWVVLPRGQAVRQPEAGPPLRQPLLRKSREMCGPLGQAFVSPFRVCYGTLGSDSEVRKHREEAEAFCKGWDEFLVHETALQASPEDDLADWDIERENIVVFGTLDTSRILKRAQATCPMPLEVYADRVVVRDALTGDREYRGSKYGVFSAYPNPLSGGKTYLVTCKGRYASQPGGKELRGLEFDLEKLAWGYSDYVIFNTDEGDLPHVMNVNNKPPVTCYEAGYFVEAGYYDADWQLDRFATIDRVKRTKPEGVRLIHVSEVQVAPTTSSLPVFGNIDGDPVDPERKSVSPAILAATVKVVDSAGSPVRQARVTGMWPGQSSDAISRPTLSNGIAYFPYPATSWDEPLPRFRVVNVMATGCAYDFEADCLAGSPWEDPVAGFGVKPVPLRSRIDPEFAAQTTFEVTNLRGEASSVDIEFLPPNGTNRNGRWSECLQPGQTVRKTVRWSPASGQPAGAYTGTVQVVSGEASVRRPLRVDFPEPKPLPLRFATTEGTDIVGGEGYVIRATIHNLHPTQAITVPVTCTIVEASRHLPAQQVTIEPESATEVVWRAAEDEKSLGRGEYTARMSVLGVSGHCGTAGFAVR